MKSTIYVLLIILIATSFTSCKKDCEKSNSGTLIIDNYASDPFDIYVDDVLSVANIRLIFIKIKNYEKNSNLYNANISISNNIYFLYGYKNKCWNI